MLGFWIMLPKIQNCQVRILDYATQNPKLSGYDFGLCYPKSKIVRLRFLQKATKIQKNDGLFYGNWLPKAEIFYSSVQKTQNCNLDFYLKS